MDLQVVLKTTYWTFLKDPDQNWKEAGLFRSSLQKHNDFNVSRTAPDPEDGEPVVQDIKQSS